MILQTNQQLEVGIWILSLFYGLASIFAKFVYNDLRERIDEVKKMSDENLRDIRLSDKAQWTRIDEINSSYVHRNDHEGFKKEVQDTITKAIEMATRPLLDSIERLTDKIDRIYEGRLHDRSP